MLIYKRILQMAYHLDAALMTLNAEQLKEYEEAIELWLWYGGD